MQAQASNRSFDVMTECREKETQALMALLITITKDDRGGDSVGRITCNAGAVSFDFYMSDLSLTKKLSSTAHVYIDGRAMINGDLEDIQLVMDF